MRAVKLTKPHTLELLETPIPEPGPGEVRVKVAGAGLCHSDLHVLHMGEEWPFFGGTVGHEGAGWIDALGPGIDAPAVGTPVVVHLLWNCGACRACLEGRDNACSVAGSRNTFPTTPGLGPDGAMAEYMLAPARQVEPLHGVDPRHAAPLTDAGLTPMHAINSVLHRLTPGSTTVVIGVGGLGHLGLQILKAISATRVIALDTDESKLKLARRHGADLALPSNGDAVAAILAETDGYGVDVVLDFVGVQPTVDIATGVIGPEGLLRLVGLGGGDVGFVASAGGRLPWGVDVQSSYGGTRADLLQVLALAEAGKIHVETVEYPLDDFQRAFDDLEAGRVAGRAILVP